MKMAPDDRFLTISTYMYEIAVVELVRTTKYNKAIGGDEITLKLNRTTSVGGIKVPILDYSFSNDDRYFIVSCENSKIKLFHNSGNVNNSIVVHEFEVKD